MDSILHDLRAALRRLPKAPWFALGVVAILAIAIGANTLIFSVADAVLLKSLPYGNASRLAGVVAATPHGTNGVSLPDLIDWRHQSHRIDGYASYVLSPATMTGRGAPERLNAAIVSANWFSLLGVAPGVGQVFNPSDDRPEAGRAIILSDAIWRTRFAADQSLVGQTLVLDGEAFTIIGIAPPGFTYPGTPDLWVPEILTSADYAPDLRHRHLRTVVARVATGATLDAAREEFRTVTNRLRQQYPQDEADVSYALEPLAVAIAGSARPALLVLFGAVGCVLLIACANVTNLLLVRATGRATEIALKIAIGAGRRRVIQELLAESVVLAMSGAVLGVILADIGIHMVVGAQAGGLPRLDEVALNGRTLMFSAAIALVTGALFGIGPAIHASRADLGESLKSATRGSSGHRLSGRVRGGLVVGETALAVVLLVGAGLLTRSFIHLMDVDLGFRPTQVVAFDVNFYTPQYADWARVREFVHAVKARVLAIPGSQRVAYGFGVPFAGYPDSPVNIEIQGRPVARDQQLTATTEPISAGYFATLGVPIKEGREFTDDDRSDGRRVLVINETAAHRFFPQGDAIGHHITIDVMADSTGKGDSVQLGGDIVGVVGDTKFADPTAPALAQIFQPHEQVSRAFITFVVRTTADPASVIAASARAVSALDGTVPIFHARALTTDVAASVARPRLYTMVVATFAAVSLALAVIGIYGVLAYAVRERRRELGIRLALGARGDQLVGLVVLHGLRLAGIGLAIGCVMALIGGRLLTSLLFGVHPNDLMTYAIVCGALLCVAALASWLPARGAAAIDPIIAMRAE
jgi:putative ABC transport system permease protein